MDTPTASSLGALEGWPYNVTIEAGETVLAVNEQHAEEMVIRKLEEIGIKHAFVYARKVDE